MSFMLGVLGSLLFWLGYGASSLIIAAFIMRSCGQDSFSYIVLSTGHHPIRFPHHHNNNGESVYYYKAGDEDATLGERTAAIFGLLGHVVFWPLVAVVFGGYHLFKLFAVVFFGGSSKVMQYLFKALPNVEISVKKEKKEE